jgi:antitoxin HigA-1
MTTDERANVTNGIWLCRTCTLKDLEDVTGVKESNLSALENDRIEMTSYYAERLGAALGIHPSLLLYPEGWVKVTPEMALSLADAFGNSPQFWLNLQLNYDLWQASQGHRHISRLKGISA